MPIHVHILQQTILTHKLGQTDLVSEVLAGFISRSVHATLQVSVCSGYNLVNIQTQTDRQRAF